MVKDTACENCPFKEMGYKECPNYIETIWNEIDNPEPRIVRDCAPRRSLLLLQELLNKSFAVQAQASQMEGEVVKLRGVFSQLIQAIQSSMGKPLLPPHKFTPVKDTFKGIPHVPPMEQ